MNTPKHCLSRCVSYRLPSEHRDTPEQIQIVYVLIAYLNFMKRLPSTRGLMNNGHRDPSNSTNASQKLTVDIQILRNFRSCLYRHGWRYYFINLQFRVIIIRGTYE